MQDIYTSRVRDLVQWPLFVLLIALGCVTERGEQAAYFILAFLLLAYRQDFFFIRKLIETVQSGVVELRSQLESSLQLVNDKINGIERKLLQLEARLPTEGETQPLLIAQDQRIPWYQQLVRACNAVLLVLIILLIANEMYLLRSDTTFNSVRIVETQNELTQLRSQNQLLSQQVSNSIERSQQLYTEIQQQQELQQGIFIRRTTGSAASAGNLPSTDAAASTRAQPERAQLSNSRLEAQRSAQSAPPPEQNR